MVPSKEQILNWTKKELYELLSKNCANYDNGHPFKAIEFEVIQWPSRTLHEWTNDWNSDAFDSIYSLLPKLLQESKILVEKYYRYSYDEKSNQGSWFDADGSKVAEDLTSTQKSIRFAVLYTETPICHYTLLERRQK